MSDKEAVSNSRQPLIYHSSPLLLVRPLAIVAVISAVLLMADLSGKEGAGVLHAIIVLVALFYMIRPLMLLADSKYEVTANHIRTCTGKLSLNREEVHIPYEEVKGVRTRQTILERLLGIGDVLIWTGFTQTPDAIFRKVSNPSAVAVTISDRVDQALIGMKNRPADSHQQSG